MGNRAIAVFFSWPVAVCMLQTGKICCCIWSIRHRSRVVPHAPSISSFEALCMRICRKSWIATTQKQSRSSHVVYLSLVTHVVAFVIVSSGSLTHQINVRRIPQGRLGQGQQRLHRWARFGICVVVSGWYPQVCLATCSCCVQLWGKGKVIQTVLGAFDVSDGRCSECTTFTNVYGTRCEWCRESMDTRKVTSSLSFV